MEKLLDDPNIVSVEAPVDANVWKVEVCEGDEAGEGTVVSGANRSSRILMLTIHRS